MKRKTPIWLMGVAAILLVGLIVNQIFWVFNSAAQQEAQFNKQTQMALSSIEQNIQEDAELQSSVDCCLVEEQQSSCVESLQDENAWERTDKMIAAELKRFDIDLHYNFDICYAQPKRIEPLEGYEQNMDKVFDQSGIVLYLEFPDKSKYLRNQIGPVFISSILFIVFLSFVFALTYRYYKRERAFSQRTRDFINNMTHEFKTPLTNISLANSMIARGLDAKDHEKLLHYSSIISDENLRLTKNCDDLLQMAKIENSDSEFVDVIDVHEIIDAVVLRKRKTKVPGVFTIKTALNAKNCRVLGKESLFSNTVSNLIDNAIKYSNKSVEIIISTENVAGEIKLRIEDNGIGMEEEHISNIFDKFYRVPEGDKHDVKGFGLGLAYVKMVINKMKGNIKVESKFGFGTTFNIIIPISNNS
jgi:two-component system phosphate regulon sensor histidine kinase PhoR